MPKMKTAVVVPIVIAIAAAVFVFCKWYGASPPAEQKARRIAFVVPVLDNPFFVDMTNAAKARAAELGGVEVMVKSSTSVEDAIGQNQIVEDSITQHVDAIVVVPTNSEGIIPAIQKANAAHIPVINIDNRIDEAKAAAAGVTVSGYIGSDNFDGGKLAGQYVAERLGGKGEVAILEGVSGNDAAIKRKAGFLEALKASPGIKVVASQVANWNREQGFGIFQNILKAHPKLNALFACNDEMVLGAAAALEQAKVPRTSVVMVGFDATKEAVDAIHAGKIDATIAQQPALMGAKGLDLALDIVNGRVTPKSVSTELKVIRR